MPTQYVSFYDPKTNGASGVWASPNAFATSLVTMLIDAYSSEALTWHPNTIEMEIESDFSIALPPANFERLMTAISLLTSNAFFTSLPDFNRDCVVLNGHYVGGDHLEMADAADCAWGITEALLLVPPEGPEPFTEEIRGFLGYVLGQEGIITPPDVLRIALRDRDLAEHVRYNFSDDPEMFGAIHKMEKSKTDAIDALIRGRLRALLKQLSRLKLRSVAAEHVANLVDRMLAALPEVDEDLPLPD